jgi:hypothetical protein
MLHRDCTHASDRESDRVEVTPVTRAHRNVRAVTLERDVAGALIRAARTADQERGGVTPQGRAP